MTETKKCANNIFARWNYITKTKPNLNPNPTPLVFLLGLGLVLDFVLVTIYPAGQKYCWHIFWSQLLLFSAHLRNDWTTSGEH